MDNVEREREKGKNYDPFQFMQKTSERAREGILFWKKREELSTAARRFCAVVVVVVVQKGRRRQTQRISLILIKSYCNMSPSVSNSRDAIRDLYMWMHTQMFYSKGLIFLSFTSLCSDLSRSSCMPCMYWWM